MNIFENLRNLNVSEKCIEDIISIIKGYMNEEIRVEDSPLWAACNGKPPLTKEQQEAYNSQLEASKKKYAKEQARLKRLQNKKPKSVDPNKVPGQQKLF